jgi:hypothetical protein
VLARFGLRLAILVFFAIASPLDARLVLSNLMVMAASFCVILAQARRERMNASVLTHWDEAAAYTLIYIALRSTMPVPAIQQ